MSALNVRGRGGDRRATKGLTRQNQTRAIVTSGRCSSSSFPAFPLPIPSRSSFWKAVWQPEKRKEREMVSSEVEGSEKREEGETNRSRKPNEQRVLRLTNQSFTTKMKCQFRTIPDRYNQTHSFQPAVRTDRNNAEN